MPIQDSEKGKCVPEQLAIFFIVVLLDATLKTKSSQRGVAISTENNLSPLSKWLIKSEFLDRPVLKFLKVNLSFVQELMQKEYMA